LKGNDVPAENDAANTGFFVALQVGWHAYASRIFKQSAYLNHTTWVTEKNFPKLLLFDATHQFGHGVQNCAHGACLRLNLGYRNRGFPDSHCRQSA
jgi:hypothetical protein